MTLQQIAMAKSNVLFYEGAAVACGYGRRQRIGVSKVGRYTSEGAGNATTDIKPGKSICPIR
jgi:hypothetical protein